MQMGHKLPCRLSSTETHNEQANFFLSYCTKKFILRLLFFFQTLSSYDFKSQITQKGNFDWYQPKSWIEYTVVPLILLLLRLVHTIIV